MRPNENGRSAVVALALLAAVWAGCGGADRVDRSLVSHRIEASAETVCDSLMRAASAEGYEVIVAQPARGRFAVRATYADRFGSYAFAVECEPDRIVTVRPLGPRIEPLASADLLPRRLVPELLSFRERVEAELARLAAGGPRWQQALPEPRPEPPTEYAGTYADDGIVITGALGFTGAYLTGSLTSIALSCGGTNGCRTEQAVLAFAPFGHFLSWGGAEAIVSGIVFSVLELVAVIVMFAGESHHRAGPGALSAGPGTLTLTF